MYEQYLEIYKSCYENNYLIRQFINWWCSDTERLAQRCVTQPQTYSLALGKRFLPPKPSYKHNEVRLALVIHRRTMQH